VAVAHIWESGDNWWFRSGQTAPTISVIEKPSESYDAYHERKKREENRRRVSFGFSRVLDEQKPAKRRRRH
jgi:general stress protein 26